MANDDSANSEWYCEHDYCVDTRQCIKGVLLHAENTGFQDLKIFEHSYFGRVLVLDDIIQTTTRDEFVYHEMMTHVPLIGLTGPEQREKSVLIIGGGDGGILREVLVHDFVTKVVMVEIDEAVIRTTREYLGFNGDYDDPRVELLITDGATYMKSDAARQIGFDLIIVDAPDPIGPAEMLYSDEFTADMTACLNDTGAIVRHIGLPFPMIDMLHDCTKQLEQHFSLVEVYSADVPSYLGGNIAFTVATKDGRSAKTPRFDYEGKYYNPELHRACFSLPTWWKRTIAGDCEFI